MRFEVRCGLPGIWIAGVACITEICRALFVSWQPSGGGGWVVTGRPAMRSGTV
jgi:hypothetical protein